PREPGAAADPDSAAVNGDRERVEPFDEPALDAGPRIDSRHAPGASLECPDIPAADGHRKVVASERRGRTSVDDELAPQLTEGRPDVEEQQPPPVARHSSDPYVAGTDGDAGRCRAGAETERRLPSGSGVDAEQRACDRVHDPDRPDSRRDQARSKP